MAMPAKPSRPPHAARRLAGTAWLLLGAVALGLPMLQAMPRDGLPVLLVFPPGLGADRALAGLLGVQGWDPAMVRSLGPLTIAIAAPALPGMEAGRLRRNSGAFIVLAAIGRAACAARIT